MASRGPFQPKLLYSFREKVLKKSFRCENQNIKIAFNENA